MIRRLLEWLWPTSELNQRRRLDALRRELDRDARRDR